MNEAVSQLAFAEAKLAEAEQLRDGHERIALREAYLAALSSVRTILFAVSRATPKTHRGTRTLYMKLFRDRPDLHLPDAQFLKAGFDAKQEIDYGDFAGAHSMSADEALETARSYLAAARRVVGDT